MGSINKAVAGLNKSNQTNILARIVKAEADEVNDVVRWETVLPDGAPYYLHWPIADFGHAMGVTKPGVRIPMKLLTEFLESLVSQGKQFNLTITDIPELEAGDVDAVNDQTKGFLNEMFGK